MLFTLNIKCCTVSINTLPSSKFIQDVVNVAPFNSPAVQQRLYRYAYFQNKSCPTTLFLHCCSSVDIYSVSKDAKETDGVFAASGSSAHCLTV